LVDDLLYFEEQLYILERLACFYVLEVHHGFLLANHFRFNKTLELISIDFWWYQMLKVVKKIVFFCNVCFKSKNPWLWPYGFLLQLPILKHPWSFVAISFIVDLPLLCGFDLILAGVDCLTKMADFVLCTKTINEDIMAKLFLENIYLYHKLYEDTASNWGPHFVSKFWKYLFKDLKMKIEHSFAFHSQTNGQT